MMIWPYSFEQMRMAYLKTKAGPAEKVAIGIAIAIAIIIVSPILIFFNVIVARIIGTLVGVVIYVIVFGKIRKTIMKCYYAKNLKALR